MVGIIADINCHQRAQIHSTSKSHAPSNNQTNFNYQLDGIEEKNLPKHPFLQPSVYRAKYPLQ